MIILSGLRIAQCSGKLCVSAHFVNLGCSDLRGVALWQCGSTDCTRQSCVRASVGLRAATPVKLDQLWGTGFFFLACINSVNEYKMDYDQLINKLINITNDTKK